MEYCNNYQQFSTPIEKDPFSFLQISKNDCLTSKNPSFLRQSTNSMDNFSLNHPSKEFTQNPYLSEKTNSIPELKDLNQERALSRLKSRGSSNSKSPKNGLNFNGNQTQFLKDLESQWRNLKEDHRNFITRNENKGSFISVHKDKDETPSYKKSENSLSPSRLITFNQNFEESHKIEDNRFYQNSEKKSNLLTPNKFLKKSVPHSKINLDLCKKILNTNPMTNSARNTPEKFSREKITEKREYSPCTNHNSNHQFNSGKDNQQHFKMILNKYANIYKKNIEIDLTNLNTNKTNIIIKNNSQKVCSEDDKKSLNNSKVSTNTGKSENIKKSMGLSEKIQENKLKITSSLKSQNSIRNNGEFEKNNPVLNERINDKLRKINTTKIYLKEEDISMDIPSENKDLDLGKKEITQSPQYFKQKNSFGSVNLNSENSLTKNEKFQKNPIDAQKKNALFQKDRDILKSNFHLKTEKYMINSYTPKKEGSKNMANDKVKGKDITPKNSTKTESSIDRNPLDYSDRRSKNNKNFPTPSYLLTTEKENLDMGKLNSRFVYSSTNCIDQLKSPFENKKIIEGLYKNCIGEKNNDEDLKSFSNMSKNLNSSTPKKDELDFGKKMNLTLDESKISSFALSIPNGESIIGFPFAENNEKITFSMKNFNKPFENKTKIEDDKMKKFTQNYKEIPMESSLKNPDLGFSFHTKKDKGFSLLSEKMNYSEKYFNLK